MVCQRTIACACMNLKTLLLQLSCSIHSVVLHRLLRVGISQRHRVPQSFIRQRVAPGASVHLSETLPLCPTKPYIGQQSRHYICSKLSSTYFKVNEPKLPQSMPTKHPKANVCLDNSQIMYISDNTPKAHEQLSSPRESIVDFVSHDDLTNPRNWQARRKLGRAARHTRRSVNTVPPLNFRNEAQRASRASARFPLCRATFRNRLWGGMCRFPAVIGALWAPILVNSRQLGSCGFRQPSSSLHQPMLKQHRCRTGRILRIRGDGYGAGDHRGRLFRGPTEHLYRLPFDDCMLRPIPRRRCRPGRPLAVESTLRIMSTWHTWARDLRSSVSPPG
jgi:hypothetical protein